MNVKNKMILVTGGAGGLGSAMARLLSENGAKVLIMDLEAVREKGEALSAEIKAAGGEGLVPLRRRDLRGGLEARD